MTTILSTPTAPPLARAGRIRLVAAAPDLWRVTDGERIIGHLQAVAGAHGTRYRARRFQPTRRSFTLVGEFWSADDAVDALRFGR